MSSYAYGGSSGGPCTDDPWTGEHRHNYGNPGTVGIEFARPHPVHTQTPGALEAVEAMVAAGVEKRAARAADTIVTEHGVKPTEPHLVPEYRTTKKGKRKPTGRMVPADVVTANAKRLVAAAERVGMRVNVIELADRCTVEGIHTAKGVAFRATWVRGRATGATWHERTPRYGFVDDPRPLAKKSELTKTSNAGGRPIGVDRVHLKILASPAGVAISQAELISRVSAV